MARRAAKAAVAGTKKRGGQVGARDSVSTSSAMRVIERKFAGVMSRSGI
jgi:hypothetical protein